MKEKITDALVQISYDGDFNQKAGSEGNKEENHTQYLPPL